MKLDLHKEPSSKLYTEYCNEVTDKLDNETDNELRLLIHQRIVYEYFDRLLDEPHNVLTVQETRLLIEDVVFLKKEIDKLLD